MASEQMIYKNPTTGVVTYVQQNLNPAVAQIQTGKQIYPRELAEMALKLTATLGGTAITAYQPLVDVYENLLSGAEFTPHAAMQGMETYLAADLAIGGTSMTVLESTCQWPGRSSENIFVANRPILIMNTYPTPDRSMFGATVQDGLLLPNAEIAFVGSGYTSGTTVTIVRGTGAAARKRFAIVRALPEITGSMLMTGGLIAEAERPDALTFPATGTPTSPVANTITIAFVPSAQTAEDDGVVTAYGIWVIPATGNWQWNLNAGLPVNAAPSQYDSSGQVDAVLALDSAKLVTATVGGLSCLTVSGLNRAWNPATCALETLTTGADYWVIVRAMNQTSFNANLRLSLPVGLKVEVS